MCPGMPMPGLHSILLFTAFRATPLVLSTLQIKIEGKSNHAGWAQQNDFGLAFLHSLLRLITGTAKPNTFQSAEK